MLLWTIVPQEVIFAAEEYCPAYEEIDYSGMKMMVEKQSPTEYRIVRLLSTDPNDYLRPEIQPGMTLTYKPA
jgi:hypothetical protein